jgi:hypothetical protein
MAVIMRTMESWLKTGVVIVAMAIVGFLGSFEASSLVSPRGEIGPTILQAQSPISAVIAILITVGIASVIGGIVAKYTSTTSGMLVLGFSLFAMAMKLDGIEAFVYGGGNFYLLILEAIFLSVIVMIGTIVVFAIGGPLKDVPKATQKQPNDIWVALLISLAILPVVYFVATSPMRGQVIGAAAVGGIAIGFLARYFTPTMQPLVLYALPIAMGGLGYLIGMTTAPVTDVAIAQQQISPLLFPMPIEYAAGLLIGLSIGLGWAASLAEKPDTDGAEKLA